MTGRYSYQASTEYISGLKFDHVETYSFQRGDVFNGQLQNNITLFKDLGEASKTQGPDPKEEDAFNRLKAIAKEDYIINGDGKFHSSSERKSVLQRTDDATGRLIAILKTPAIDVPAWMCAPVYRDAIIFYDAAGMIVSALNICFSCQYMATAPFTHVDADASVYQDLKTLLRDLGHVVEER